MIETNFKHTDLGLIPHDWEVKTIKEIATLINGRAYRQDELLPEGKYKVLRVGNFFTNDSWYYSNLELEDKLYCHKGDLLYAWSCTFGAYIWNEDNTIFHYHIWRVECNNVAKKYLYYLLNDDVEKQKSASQGSTMTHITKGYLEQRSFPIPPTLAEQERIAGALSSIDTLIGALNEQIEKKRHIKQGAMQQLLTGKKRLAGFTGEWEERRLDEIGFLTAGGTPSTMEPSYWDGDINWLQSGAVQNCIITPDAVIKTITKAGLQNSAAYLIKPDSVLIAITGATCANVGYLTFESAANQSVVSIEPNEENCAMFLFQKLLTERTNILSNKGGSAQSGVTLKALKQLTIVVPPTIAEQSAIATVLSRMDTEIAALEQKRDKYIAIKSGMMQNLLTGKIRLV